MRPGLKPLQFFYAYAALKRRSSTVVLAFVITHKVESLLGVVELALDGRTRASVPTQALAH
jgi:hypothetical protein